MFVKHYGDSCICAEGYSIRRLYRPSHFHGISRLHCGTRTKSHKDSHIIHFPHTFCTFPESWRQPLGKLVGEAEKLVQRHPTIEARAAALQAWVDSPEWTAIQQGDYVKRQDQPRPGTLDELQAGATRLRAGLSAALGGLGWRR